MKVRVFSLTHPVGVEKDASFLTPAVMECIETTGVFRGTCPCCDKTIVVRMIGERSAMTAGDEHFLLHGSKPQ